MKFQEYSSFVDQDFSKNFQHYRDNDFALSLRSSKEIPFPSCLCSSALSGFVASFSLVILTYMESSEND